MYGSLRGKWIDEDGDGRYDVLEVETRTESLVSRRKIRAGLHEAADPVEVATIGGLVQRPGRPLRELQRSLERLARMHRFAMGDDHPLEREVEHRAQVRQRPILVSGGHPHPQHSSSLG
jgi:hypothetical protein